MSELIEKRYEAEVLDYAVSKFAVARFREGSKTLDVLVNDDDLWGFVTAHARAVDIEGPFLLCTTPVGPVRAWPSRDVANGLVRLKPLKRNSAGMTAEEAQSPEAKTW